MAAAVAPAMNAAADDEYAGHPEVAVLFVGISLAMGIACRQILRGTRVPYTVALLILGISLGTLEYGTNIGLGKLGAGIRLWASINPTLLLFVFLPALLFESSFAMEVHQIKRCMVQMVLLAGPGVLISTFFLGFTIKFLFPYNWGWKISLLLGGLLSATDPVAVVALLKELGASKKLRTIMEGESLINDGTAIVVYQLFYEMVIGRSVSVGDIIEFLSKVSLGAIAVGLAFGIASVLWLGYIFNDTVIEITLTVAVSYIAYFTAQGAAGVSGVLTVMTLGIFYAAVARTAFKGDSQQSLHHFWEMISYIANTLIFILSGVVIAEGMLHKHNHLGSNEASWGYLVLLYVFVQLSRFVVVFSLYPFLRFFGYGLDWKEAMILIWSGLRGAVSLSLALSVKRASDNMDVLYISQEVGNSFVFFTGGIVFLTLIINGTTTQLFLHLLHMDGLSETKVRILNYTRYEMLKKALDAFRDLGDDEELGPADWPTVRKHITCLHNLQEEQMHPHNLSVNESHIQIMNLKDIRVRLLNGVQAAYWEMLDEGRINQTIANLLMRSVDEAMDLVSSEPLCDWKGIKYYVCFPSYYRFLQMDRIPQRLVTYLTVERLESACYIAAAFLRAHRSARRQLHEFIGDSEISSVVINESNTEGEEARKFLEDVRVTCPQVLRMVKTRQVTYSILNHLSEYVRNLEKVGLLEEKEMFHLDDAVQTDLKKLLRNPSRVKIPKVGDLLSNHPLLGALPASLREQLQGSKKEIMKICGATLYKEGSKPNGIWLISSGVVKWASKILGNMHSLHPTFSHGSTLGLYEVLVGKSYICDMVTDSVVHCFFLQSERVLSLLRNGPIFEDFLWQESVLVIAKLLLPQLFEKVAMQDLRGLVSDRSTMNIYVRGEVLEVKPNSIGFLLEGFVKAQGAQYELITSPSALLSSSLDLGFLGLVPSGTKNASFCHPGSCYLVETRTRVMFIDMVPIGSDRTLHRRASSLVSPSVDLGCSISTEHGGLLSWPESFFNMRAHHQTLEDMGSQSMSLSTKAIDLNIYWNVIKDIPKAPTKSSEDKHSHSLSCPRIPSREENRRPLLSSQSEITMKGRQSPKNTKEASSHCVAISNRRGKAILEDHSSDDESGGDEEAIVKIDSPSTLFHHAI